MQGVTVTFNYCPFCFNAGLSEEMTGGEGHTPAPPILNPITFRGEGGGGYYVPIPPGILITVLSALTCDSVTSIC